MAQKSAGRAQHPPPVFLPGISDTCIDTSLTIRENVNNQAAIIIQIETLEGIRNLDAILTEVGEHIDSVWLGFLDARISMGLPGSTEVPAQEPEWVEVVALYESTMAKHNEPASGLALGSSEAKASMAKGKSFLCVAADIYGIMFNGLEELGHFRKEFPAQSYEEVYKKLQMPFVHL